MSDADGVGANPFLRRERSRNLQFGANLSASSLLTDGDLAQSARHPLRQPHP